MFPIVDLETMTAMQRWVAQILLAVISVIGTLVLIEIGLRVGGYSPSFVNPLLGFNVRDPILGHRGRPNIDQRFRERDFDVAVQHDAEGFRKPGRPHAVPQGAPTLLVFGDSFTWGWGVEQGGIFTDQLSDDFPGVSVRNLGIGGIGTLVEFRLFETGGFAKSLRPGDTVAVMFFRNDFEDNVAGRLSATVRGGEVVPNDVNIDWDQRLDALRSRVYLFNLISYNLEAYFKSRRQAQLAAIGEDSTAARVTEYYLSQFKKQSEAVGARFLVVEIPDRSLYGEGVADQRILDHCTTAHTLLLKLTRKLGIETLDLLPAFRTAAQESPGQPLAFANDSHWNASGHRVAARAIADRLRRDGVAGASWPR